MTVAVQFAEVGEGSVNVVEGVGALRVARQLCDLPVVEAGEDAFGEGAGFALQALNFVAEINFGLAAELAQFGQFVFEFGDGLFKFEVVGVHASAHGQFGFQCRQVGKDDVFVAIVAAE